MILGRIERSEIEEVFLNFGAIGNIKTNRAKDRLDPRNRQRHWMQPTSAETTARKGYIDGFGRKTLLKFGALDRVLARGQERFNRLLRSVQGFPGARFCLAGQRP